MKRKYNIGFRIISFLICVIMTANISIIVHATNENRTYSKELNFLKLLEIIDKDFEIGNFNPYDVVSRGEFAQYAAKLLKIDNVDIETLYYHDVPRTHYAYNTITALTENGYMNGVSTKMFAPEENMSTNFAYLVFLKALGVGNLSNYTENDIITFAQTFDLTKGVISGNELLLEDLFRIMYNALMAETIKFGKPSGNTLLYETREMRYKKKGLVTSVYGADIYGQNDNFETIVISGEEYISTIEAEAALGKYVEYIYSENDNLDDKELIWLNVVNDNDMLHFNSNDELDFDRNTRKLYYYSNKVRKNIEIPNNISLIYNGRFCGKNITSYFEKDRVDITFLKVESMEYNVAIMWDYTPILVKQKDSSIKMIYGRNSGEYVNLNEEDYSYIKICSEAGIALSFEEIEDKDVLNVYKSNDNERIKVVVGKETVTGRIQSADSSEGVIVIDDNTFEFYSRTVPAGIGVGMNVELYLDENGLVVYCATGSAIGLIGFMYDASVVELPETCEEGIMLKILQENGELIKVFGEKVRIDNIKYTDAQSMIMSLSNNGGTKITPQLILYNINSKGYISMIYTASENDGKVHKLTKNHTTPKYGDFDTTYDEARFNWQYNVFKNNRIGLKMLVNENTKIFIVPEDSEIETAEEKEFNVVNTLNIDTFCPGAESYFTSSEEPGFEQYVVVRGVAVKTTIENSFPMYMYDSEIEELNDDDEVVTIVRVFDIFGNPAEKFISEDSNINWDTHNFKRGDIIRFAEDKYGEIKNVQVLYQPSKGIKTGLSEHYPPADYRIFSGYVNDFEAPALRIGYNDGNSYDEAVNIGSLPVVIYDTYTKTIEKGTVNDLRSYKNVGNKCTFIYMQMTQAKPVGIFAIK